MRASVPQPASSGPGPGYGLDYREIGLTVGLEIHQQLDTREKLFCGCPPRILEDLSRAPAILRGLRAGKSELGEVDPAALFEYRRGRLYRYLAPPEASCLVELDEEPPHELNREAVIVALAIALALGASPVDEVHVMRKIVVDGSNTSGFQRTAVIALGGRVDDEEGAVRIQSVTLEEDSARKVGEEGGVVAYSLDRLGIPLVEISTGPDIRSPEQAERVAHRIGMILRLTGKVKRGLGTIRQDLNISVRGGAKVEVKGVQRLELISKVVEYEAYRQRRLLELRDEILRRGLDRQRIAVERLVDVTEEMRGSGSRALRAAVERGGSVLALPLEGFKGLLGWELGPGRRFGSELADYARQWGGVGGLIHSDELPGYGIDSGEVEKIYRILGLSPDRDAFTIIADRREKAIRAFEAVASRIRQAFDGVPRETRAAEEDGTTRYMRPQPGAARMYPETDIPPLRIDEEILARARELVPEPLEAKLRRFVEQHGLSRELAEQVIRSRFLPLYEEVVSKMGDKIPPTLVASTIVNTLRALRAEGVEVEKLDEDGLEEVFRLAARGAFAKEAIPDVIKYVCEKGASPSKAVEDLGLRRMDLQEIERIVDEIVEANRQEILRRGERAHGMIMGRVMEVLRGKADGKTVSEVVRKRLSKILGG